MRTKNTYCIINFTFLARSIKYYLFPCCVKISKFEVFLINKTSIVRFKIKKKNYLVPTMHKELEDNFYEKEESVERSHKYNQAGFPL